MKSVLEILSAIIFIFVWPVSGFCHDGSNEVNRSFFLMGTDLEVQIEAKTHDEALLASEAVFKTVAKTEKRLSTWEKDSELSKVNESPLDKEFSLSKPLFKDLTQVFEYAKETGYAFDPGIGPLVFAWDLRGHGRVPDGNVLKRAIRASRPGAFEFSRNGIIRKDEGARIEEGGFGKGIGLDEALDSIKELAVKSVMLNFGGQISYQGAEPIEVGIANPLKRKEVLLRLSMFSGSASTSGNSEHGHKIGNAFVGHILNPFTGRPSSYSGSVTVLAERGVEADCLSTGFFVMGPVEGLKLLKKIHNEKHSKTQALFVDRDSKTGRWTAQASCGLKNSLKKSKIDVLIKYDCEE